jgi:hypothetical protein
VQITHGLISLLLIISAVATALGAIVPKSFVMGLLYVAVIAVCGAAVVFSYCAKCPCRKAGCGHVLFGWLAMKFTKRKEGPYGFFDLTVTAVSIAAILLLPQLWLIESIPTLVLFWALMILAGLDIVFLVCPDCSNRFCAFNRERMSIRNR